MGDLIERLTADGWGSDEMSAHVIKAAAAPKETWVDQSRFNGKWCIYARPEKPRLWEIDDSLRGACVTTSLDAGLALAERVLPGWLWSAGTLDDGTAIAVFDDLNGSGGFSESRAATPALALCAAILTACQSSPLAE